MTLLAPCSYGLLPRLCFGESPPDPRDRALLHLSRAVAVRYAAGIAVGLAVLQTTVIVQPLDVVCIPTLLELSRCCLRDVAAQGWFRISVPLTDTSAFQLHLTVCDAVSHTLAVALLALNSPCVSPIPLIERLIVHTHPTEVLTCGG